MKIASIFVLYNPTIPIFIKNFDKARMQSDFVIVIDNSECVDPLIGNFIFSMDKALYMPLSENYGIAYALNLGCKIAISKGYHWVMTLDQDSEIPDRMIEKMLNRIYTNRPDIGLIGPLFKKNDCYTVKESDEFVEVDALITSGSLISLHAYKVIGGFKNELFIDAVDTEFCWNLRVNGFHIYQDRGVVLNHHLGSLPYDIKICTMRLLTVTNHNYIRCYYIVRNSLAISKNYKQFLPKDTYLYKKKGIKLLVKVILFESDKIRKIRYIIKGYIDFRKGITGKLMSI